MQAIYNTTQNTISIQPAAPVDAATFARLKHAGFSWQGDAAAFIATPANELARGVAADIAGHIETRDAAPKKPATRADYNGAMLYHFPRVELFIEQPTTGKDTVFHSLALALNPGASETCNTAAFKPAENIAAPDPAPCAPASDADAPQAADQSEDAPTDEDDAAGLELCADIERATYSPEDNKIRLYPARRLDPEIYARVKAAGFSWAPKQGVFVAPMWTPARADLAEALAGEIEDEDSTLSERADQRADRFEDYSDKRAADADHARAAVDAIAQNIPFGQPILIGHHSERHARRDAQRIEDGMRRAVKLWDTSEYWTRRAAGAVRHAKYKQLPGVRARRIKTIEADQRKAQRTLDQSEKFRTAWHKVESLAQALQVANYDYVSRCYHLADWPRNPPASQYEGSMGLWSALDGGILTAAQARDIAIISHARTISHARRWIAHHANRIAYERAMLAESGGLESDRVKPEKGGAIQCLWAPRGGWAWIVKINQITVSILHNYGNGGRNFKHNVPLDKIREVMSAADVEAARAAGRLVETSDQVGFYLAEPKPEDSAPAETVQASGEEAAAQVQASGEENHAQASGEESPAENIAAIADSSHEPAADQGAAFDAMRASLRAGVQVVAAPQLFPTPAGLAARMVELADIQPGARVLEPSAGTGRLLEAMREAWPVGTHGRPTRTAVEINPHLCDRLEISEAGAFIVRGDFLAMNSLTLGRFDRIVMNPPFTNGADIKHIQHAAGLLKPGGRLVALCANGPRQRAALQPLADSWEDLPAGSFAESGTGVNVALLVIEAPAATGSDDDRAGVQASGEAPDVPTSGEAPAVPTSGETPASQPAGEAWRARDFDPTTPANYAQIIDNAAALLYWQDNLDSFFGSRLVEIRNALRGLGWQGGIYPAPAWPLTHDRDGAAWRLLVEVQHVGAGRNLSGVTWRALDAAGVERLRHADDLTSSAEMLAGVLDYATQHAQPLADATEPQPAAPAVQASGEDPHATPSGEYRAPTYPRDHNARELVQAVEKVDLLKRFDYLKQATDNPLVTAAKNIRTELKRAWPRLKFSVTSERFSMGDAIRIHWTDGPTSKQVEAIANKYKAGSFDGMEDIYNYDSTGFNALFGDAKYVSTSRTHSDASKAAALAQVARKFGAAPLSLADYKDGGAWKWQTPEGHQLDSEVHQALCAADYSLEPLAQAI